MELAPIALFVYHRPEHARQTIEALLKNVLAKDSELFIFSDGPKNNAELRKVREVREYIKTIAGFRLVTVIEREKNCGLANSIISGVTDLCKKSGRVIVVEDDLIVSPHFLEYMNKALMWYENEKRVMQISGHMFPVEMDIKEDAFFLPFTTSWGWGTWERAWDYFDPKMKGYEILKKDKPLRRRFDLDGSYAYFRMLERQFKGNIDSWAIRWYLSVFMLDGLTLFPKRSLVYNMGFDGSGAHCSVSGAKLVEAVDNDFVVQKYPNAWIGEKIQKEVFGFLASQAGLGRKILHKIEQWSG